MLDYSWKPLVTEKNVRATGSIKKKYYSEAINAYDSGDYKRAKEFFEKILAVDPSHARSKAMVQKCEEKMR